LSFLLPPVLLSRFGLLVFVPCGFCCKLCVFSGFVGLGGFRGSVVVVGGWFVSRDFSTGYPQVANNFQRKSLFVIHVSDRVPDFS
jgi:hypothetical protein